MSEGIDSEVSELNLQGSSLSNKIEALFKRHNLRAEGNIKSKLIKISADTCASEDLYDILSENDSILNNLEKLHDDRGIILSNIISGQRHLLPEILNDLRWNIRNSKMNYSKMKFSVSVFLTLVSKFDNKLSGSLSLFLNLINPIYETSYREDYKSVSISAFLIILRSIEADRLTTLEDINDYFETNLSDQSLPFSDFMNYISIADMLFPVEPQFMSDIYMKDSFRIQLLKFTKISSNDDLKSPNKSAAIRETLNLVSSSCVFEACRSYNAEKFLDLLQNGSHLDTNIEIKLLSTLVISKLWGFINKNKNSGLNLAYLVDITGEGLTHFNDNPIASDSAIESLAYLTLSSKGKHVVRQNPKIISSICQILSLNNKQNILSQSSTYGIFNILKNLTSFHYHISNKDKKTIDYLKKKSQPSALDDSSEDTKEARDEALKFGKALLIDNKIVEKFSKLKSFGFNDENRSSKLLILFINLVSNISWGQEKAIRQELVKQGAVNILLGFLINNSKVVSEYQTRPAKSEPQVVDARLNAIRSLARITISVNPVLVFKKYDIKTSVSFLVELLGPDISNYSSGIECNSEESYLYENVTNLDKYESLLSLTNIASTDSSELKKTIIKKTFDSRLNNFILETSLPQIQNATWELITNLIIEPSMLEKFFNMNGKNASRLSLLINLLNSEDLRLQTTIAGLLANATSEYDLISSVLVDYVQFRNQLTDILTEVLESQKNDSELILRISYILLYMLMTAKRSDNIKLKYFQQHTGLKKALSNVIASTSNEELVNILSECLNVIA